MNDKIVPPQEVTDAVRAAVEKHCHIDTRWPSSARIDDMHMAAFVADLRAALAAEMTPEDYVVAWRWKVSPDQLNWQYSAAPPATHPVYNLELLYSHSPAGNDG